MTREADPPPPMPAMAIKPQVPAKPAHIRPGLKPVKIPTVDDKVWVSRLNLLDKKPISHICDSGSANDFDRTFFYS